VHSADGQEQRHVRAEQPLLLRNLHQSRCSWIAVLVHVMTETGDEPAILALAAHD
jgi:hypothetical protein